MKNTTKFNACWVALLCLGAMANAHQVPVNESAAETTSSLSNPVTKDNLIGGWSYTVEGAPEGYRKGLMIIVKEGDEYKVQIQVGGNTLLGENVNVSGNKIDFEVMVEGGRVSVGLVAKGDTISGKSTSQEGTYTIKGERTLSM